MAGKGREMGWGSESSVCVARPMSGQKVRRLVPIGESGRAVPFCNPNRVRDMGPNA